MVIVEESSYDVQQVPENLLKCMDLLWHCYDPKISSSILKKHFKIIQEFKNKHKNMDCLIKQMPVCLGQL